jgi:hypothetical protein
MLPDIIQRLLAHRHQKRLESRLRKHDILRHYQENRKIVPEDIDLSAIHGLFWEVSLTLRHRLLSRKDLEESLDHRLITIEHEIQQINEQLHGHGHEEFSCPQDCGSSTRVNHDEFHHPRCEHCGMSMVPDGL